LQTPPWSSPCSAAGNAQAFGEEAAIQVARENVVHFRRFGGDPELGARMRHRSRGNARFTPCSTPLPPI
jgi:plasmid stabilization system protein ParE